MIGWRRSAPNFATPADPYLEFEFGSSLDQFQAASINYRIAIGPHAGQKALTLYSMPPLEEELSIPLLARMYGFTLHAGTVCEAHQRSKLERLYRYITRPPIATKRLSLDDHGRVDYRYKRPFRDGSTHVVLEPLDFIARLAALVPRPRLNLTRFHGIFAPNCKRRHKAERFLQKLGAPRLRRRGFWFPLRNELAVSDVSSRTSHQFYLALFFCKTVDFSEFCSIFEMRATSYFLVKRGCSAQT